MKQLHVAHYSQQNIGHNFFSANFLKTIKQIQINSTKCRIKTLTQHL